MRQAHTERDMVADDFPPQMKLDHFLKDLRLMLEEGQRLEVPLPLAFHPEAGLIHTPADPD